MVIVVSGMTFGPGMPTTWDVVVDHDNSQNMCAEDDIGLGLALNGHSFYQ